LLSAFTLTRSPRHQDTSLRPAPDLQPSLARPLYTGSQADCKRAHPPRVVRKRFSALPRPVGPAVFFERVRRTQQPGLLHCRSGSIVITYSPEEYGPHSRIGVASGFVALSNAAFQYELFGQAAAAVTVAIQKSPAPRCAVPGGRHCAGTRPPQVVGRDVFAAVGP